MTLYCKVARKPLTQTAFIWSPNDLLLQGSKETLTQTEIICPPNELWLP